MRDFAGEPANIEANLPTPKSVSSTTFATPIVVTTSTTHGLRPGDYITITGATDPNANGTFRAGLTATTTKVQLLDRLSGAGIAGTLAGGAAGSLQSEGFGTTYQIAEDVTDDDKAESIAFATEPLGDRTAYLMYAKKNRRRTRVTLTDANHTIDVSLGDRFQVSNAPALPRTIIIDDVSVVPRNGDTVEIIAPGPLATGQFYLIKRVGGVIIAEFWGNTLGDAGAYAEFEYVAGLWRLGANGGGGAAGGVLSGPGA